MNESKTIELTNDWQKVLDNQKGAIFNQGYSGVLILVGNTINDENAVLLPSSGFNFQQPATVWAKNQSEVFESARIGVIK